MTSHTPQLSAPNYDRSRLRPRMLHIGFGAFAKAHILVFHDEMLRRTGSDWGVVVTRLHSGSEELAKLDENEGLYTVGEMSGDALSLRQVGAVVKTIHPARDGIEALLAQIADPDLAVITLTITEKGYCLKDGGLDLGHPSISQDLARPDAPATAIGFIARGLYRRWMNGVAGLTILSCDNLPANGRLCGKAVSEFARKVDPSFGAWVTEACRFPCSMVDRITPAMTEASHQQLNEALGYLDQNGILCEPFRQWVIEDDFAGDRPAWNQADAEFVRDVAPFEDMKLRLLNGSHSFLAYLGALAGFETIADCMSSPVLKAAAKKLMLEEQTPTLDMPSGVDVARYADTLIERFSNTTLHHKTTQIASDGSQKLPQRLLASARDHLVSGRAWPLTALATAGWMLYCRGQSEDGAALPLNDPLAEEITSMAERSDGEDYVKAMLSLQQVFGEDLPASPEFTDAVQTAFRRLQQGGVLKSLSAMG